MPRRQLGRAVPSVPDRATALEAPLARTGGSEGRAAGEAGDSPGVSAGAHYADEAACLASGCTWGAGAGLTRVRASMQDYDSESSVRTPVFDAGLLSGYTFCCGTVSPSFSPERTLEVRWFRRNCKKINKRQWRSWTVLLGQSGKT